MRFTVEPMKPALFADRRERLARKLAEDKLDAFFFGGVSDLYYLTGFLSEGFFGLATGKGLWLFASALLAGQVRENAPGCRLVVGRRLSVAVESLMKKHGFRRVGFDPEQLNFRLGDVLRKKGLRPRPNPLEDLRAVKDREETDLLRKACGITAESIAHVRAHLRPGQSERALARAMEDQFHRRGAGGVAFDLIAAVGSNTALPHHIPGEARVEKNGPVLLDVGCRVGAYRSDLTRSFYCGKIPSFYKRIFDIVAAAQRAGIRAIRPGATGGQVDAAARGTISRGGYGRTFIHSTGHGVGIDIHEAPWNRPKSPSLLKPNMILTVEPGIYLPGRFGVRIEDTLRVSEDGHEVLTRTAQEPAVRV